MIGTIVFMTQVNIWVILRGVLCKYGPFCKCCIFRTVCTDRYGLLPGRFYTVGSDQKLGETVFFGFCINVLSHFKD